MVVALSRLTSRRAVVTGMGVVSPLGANAEDSWKRMIAGESAIVRVPDENLRNRLAAKIGGFVPLEGAYAFDSLKYVEGKDLRRMSLFMHYALAAAAQALEDSFIDLEAVDRDRIGVFVSSGIGGIDGIENAVIKIHESGRASPMFIPSTLINIAAGNIAMKHKFGGHVAAHCAACASGLQSIAEAAKAVILGDADIIVAGGCEGTMCETAFAGFHGCRALSTGFNDEPHKASRPWDKMRDGFVMSEGAGILIIEEYESAKKRGARIYGEITGAGVRTDHYHVTSPDPEGMGARNAMLDALNGAEMGVEDIDYVKAHATSTPAGDEVELLAATKVFAGRSKTLRMSSMKSSIGHTLGASGGIETALALLAMRDGIVPPTLNLDDPIEVVGDIDLVPNVAQQHKIKAIMSNAFGFGGINVSLVVRAL